MKNIALSLAVAGLLLVGCSETNDTQAQQAGQMQMPPMPVKAFEVTHADVIFSKSYSALLKPFQEVDVVARINGVLEKENFIEGSFVKKGDILYEIQKNEYKAVLELAQATHEKAEANFDKASKDFKRAEYLHTNKAISQQQYDELLYTYDDAKATLQGTKAALDTAQIEYNYTTIKAPISGRIGISKSDEGSYISTPNATLTTITALDPVYAEFSLPNNDVLQYRSQIKVGATVTINVGAESYMGVVDYIAPKLDSKTDTLLVRAKFSNKDENLVIGSFVEIKLDGFSYKNVATIPQYALLKTPDAILVYVIEEGGALSMRPIDIAHVKDGNAVVLNGLNEGEKIVVSNIAKLRPNSKVTIIGGN
ncbi:MAG: efflux RND transporter periplasmic adaptor subunit [Sulfurimonadaceae bacterium]|jgi:membrane fusion protein (multidrug efflux system)|nr:efflux RND transporter periplasmic adaptor subunit [Sulfurimonadaceae bacterium]